MPKTLKATLKGAKKKKSEPLWKGPEDSGTLGGVSQSMLGKFLVCRERFRLYAIEGLRPEQGWEHRSGYGDMWHVCEEHLAANKDWEVPLKDYCRELCKQYPLQQQEIEKWFNVCRVQFPVYVDYWKGQEDNLKRTPLLQEEVFRVPYTLPSSRIVYLRGKFDAVDLIGSGKKAGIYLQENKTKGQIDEIKMQRQLGFDMQTMMYLIALHRFEGKGWEKLCDSPIKGVRYNVIRRPLSGGKGSIRQHQPTKSNPEGESKEAFYARLRDDYIAKEPEYWFMRWKVEITSTEIENFKKRFLTPILEQLCWWYDEVTGQENDYPPPPASWQFPFGVYNSLTEKGHTEYDEYIESGSTIGLKKMETLFTELEE